MFFYHQVPSVATAGHHDVSFLSSTDDFSFPDEEGGDPFTTSAVKLGYVRSLQVPTESTAPDATSQSSPGRTNSSSSQTSSGSMWLTSQAAFIPDAAVILATKDSGFISILNFVVPSRWGASLCQKKKSSGTRPKPAFRLGAQNYLWINW